jgi:hypothetical protein
MKKLYTTLVALLAIVHFTQAQWNNPIPNQLTTTNMVGIGTSTPSARLDVTSTGDVASKIFAWNTSATQRSIASYIYSTSSGNSVFPTSIKPSNLASNEFGFILSNYGWNEPGASLFRVTVAGTDNTNGSPFGASGYLDALVVRNTGKVGIGTNNPVSPLHVNGAITMTTDANLNSNIYWDGTYKYVGNGYAAAIGLNANNTGGISFLTAANNINGTAATAYPTTKMLINNAGNVGIGTQSPDEMLTVNGKIHAREVKIDTSIPTPDYVFNKDYSLMSLTDVKNYIDKNHHLPEVPSAAEVEKDGLKLGEMNLILLKKVEELTLYLIVKDKELKLQKEIIHELKTAQKNLENKFEKLLNQPK